LPASSSRKPKPPTLTLALLVPRDVFGALDALGIDAEQYGDEAKALCPNPGHDDHHASWSCNLDSGEHHCFACGFGGSFMLLVGKMLGKTRAESESWVRERKIKDIAEGHTGPREPKVRQTATVSEADMWAFTDPPADALASRGLTLEACQEYGVRWDNERELWITPVRDPGTGRLWGWQAKGHGSFNNHPRDLTKSKALFGFGLVPPGGTALLVESPLDVPYVRPACGVNGVHPVSSYGASVSSEQVRLLRGQCGRVILAMDNDDAGWKSVAQLAWVFGTTRVDVFDYGNSRDVGGLTDITAPDGRDPGNLSMDDIAWGIEQAIPKWRLRIPWLT
jgi:DNA primase